jgi:glutathione-regulated potassium-efflux system ancillary protein KefF
MIDLVYAHPYPDRSRANRVLLDAVRDLPAVEVRSLYDLYPDFGIDVEAEQAALLRADALVIQFPMYWYSVPGLMKHWFDKVLVRGFAFGGAGPMLNGKRWLSVFTTGGDERAFQPPGVHGRPLADFLPPLEQTARFCGMQWEAPFALLGAHRLDSKRLEAHAVAYRERLLALAGAAAEEAGHG